MNKIYLTTGVLVATAALSICDLCKPSEAQPVTRAAASVSAPAATVLASVTDPSTVTLRIEGMTCGGCVIGVRKVLERLDGVDKVDVSYEKQRAVVTYDPTKVSVDRMIAAIKTLKYKATVAPA